MADEPTPGNGNVVRRTLADAFAEIDSLRGEMERRFGVLEAKVGSVDGKVDQLSTRLMGFPEEGFHGGRIGELEKGQERALQAAQETVRAVDQLNAMLPGMIQAGIQSVDLSNAGKRWFSTRDWLRTAFFAPLVVFILGGVIVALIEAAVHLVH